MCCRKPVIVQDLQYGDSSQASKHMLGRRRVPNLLAASLIVTWLVFLFLEGLSSGFIATAHQRSAPRYAQQEYGEQLGLISRLITGSSR